MVVCQGSEQPNVAASVYAEETIAHAVYRTMSRVSQCWSSSMQSRGSRAMQQRAVHLRFFESCSGNCVVWSVFWGVYVVNSLCAW
jgi:hypothetical protein